MQAPKLASGGDLRVDGKLPDVNVSIDKPKGGLFGGLFGGGSGGKVEGAIDIDAPSVKGGKIDVSVPKVNASLDVKVRA